VNEVERIHQELVAVASIVIQSGDVFAISDYGEHSAKTLLVAGASYFERTIIEAIKKYAESICGSSALGHYVFYQSIDQKFFALFDFSGQQKNINGFLAKFGAKYRDWAKDDLAKLDENSQRAFLELCRLRNDLVHNNYATFSIGKTLEEVKSLFDVGLKFVRWVETSFVQFEEQNQTAAG
jgi:hypothetical protein